MRHRHRPEEYHANPLGEPDDGDFRSRDFPKPFPGDRIKMWPISLRVSRPEENAEEILRLL
jgi:hypothetical protein